MKVKITQKDLNDPTVTGMLDSDIFHLQALLEADDKPFVRRALIRALMAQVEAQVEMFARDGGIPGVREPFNDRVPNSFAAYSRAKSSSWVFDVNADGWAKLLKLHTLRSRITHPKHPENLDIKDDDLKNAVEAYNWFESQVIACHRAA